MPRYIAGDIVRLIDLDVAVPNHGYGELTTEPDGYAHMSALVHSIGVVQRTSPFNGGTEMIIKVLVRSYTNDPEDPVYYPMETVNVSTVGTYHNPDLNGIEPTGRRIKPLVDADRYNEEKGEECQPDQLAINAFLVCSMLGMTTEQLMERTLPIGLREDSTQDQEDTTVPIESPDETPLTALDEFTIDHHPDTVLTEVQETQLDDMISDYVLDGAIGNDATVQEWIEAITVSNPTVTNRPSTSSTFNFYGMTLPRATREGDTDDAY